MVTRMNTFRNRFSKLLGRPQHEKLDDVYVKNSFSASDYRILFSLLNYNENIMFSKKTCSINIFSPLRVYNTTNT